MKFLKNFDIFGHKMTFYINSFETYRTRLGGAITTIVFVSFIMSIFFYGDCFSKKYPEGFEKLIENNEETKSLKIENLDFIGGFQIMDDNSKALDLEEYFYPKFTYIEAYYEGGEYKLHLEPLKTIKCNEGMLGEQYERTIFNISNFYCPDLSSIQNKSLEGSFSQSEVVKSIRFQLTVCEDEEFKICKDIKKVKKLFNEEHVWISYLFPEMNYIIDDFNRPFHFSIKNYFNSLSISAYKYEEFILTNYELDDDKGLLYGNTENEKKLAISQNICFSLIRSDQAKLSENFINFNNNRFYSAYFYYDKNRIFYSRYYQKLPEVFAEVIGTLEVILIFVIFFYNFYLQIRFESYLFKRLVLFDDNDNKNISKISDISMKDFKGKSNKFTKDEIKNIKNLFFFGNESDISNTNKLSKRNSEKFHKRKRLTNFSDINFSLNNFSSNSKYIDNEINDINYNSNRALNKGTI